MQITIECLTGSLANKAFYFDKAEITLGRGENVKKDIDFDDTDPGVSRNHGSLIVRGNRLYLNDQSRAGTMVGGQRIQGTTHELQPEDELQLGGQNGPKLRVRFQAVAKPAPPTAPTIDVLEPPRPSSETKLQPLTPASDATVSQPTLIANDVTQLQIPAQQEVQPPRTTPMPPPIQPPVSLDATIFQASNAGAYQTPSVPPPDATEFQRPSMEETMFQSPQANDQTVFQARNLDTSRTVLQEKSFPWLLAIIVGLAVTALVSFLVWFFVLHR